MPISSRGRADVYFPAARPPRASYIKSGELRALAVLLPAADPTGDVPADTWFGIGAPRNTPAAIVERLNGEINAALADPTLAAHMADGGSTVVAGSAADFGKLIADETAKWAKVIKLSGTTLS